MLEVRESLTLHINYFFGFIRKTFILIPKFILLIVNFKTDYHSTANSKTFQTQLVIKLYTYPLYILLSFSLRLFSLSLAPSLLRLLSFHSTHYIKRKKIKKLLVQKRGDCYPCMLKAQILTTLTLN